MNLTCETKALQKALDLAASVVERKSTIPILHCIRIAANGPTVTVTGTDLELGLICDLPALVTVAGQICLPAKDLKDVVKSAAKFGGQINITVHDTFALIEYPTATGTSTLKMPGMSAESFPELPKVGADSIGAFTGAGLCRLIDRTAYAISPEESRFTLNGALLQYRPGKARMVATDGHRMAVADGEMDREGDKGQCLVPKLALAACKRIWGKGDAKIAVSRDENHLFFAGPGVLLTSRLLSGAYRKPGGQTRGCGPQAGRRPRGAERET